MISINRNSIWVRFVRDNPLTRDWRNHYNLCPFMRQIVAAFVLNIVAISLAAVVLVGVILTPVLAFFVPYGLWAEWWMAFVVPGGIAWTFAFVMLVIIGITELSDRYRPVGRALDIIADNDGFKLGVGWVRAKHDKVCPPLAFKE